MMRIDPGKFSTLLLDDGERVGSHRPGMDGVAQLIGQAAELGASIVEIEINGFQRVVLTDPVVVGAAQAVGVTLMGVYG